MAGCSRGRAGGGKAIATERRAELSRETLETKVALTLDLDGSGRVRAETGIPFLDHMLQSWATHARIDLDLTAVGDLEVDPHHTVEDVSLLLGRALAQAVGDRAGIERFGDAVVPMDESVAAAAVDFSGRGHAVIRIEFPGAGAGPLPASLLAHFFEVLARESGMTLHLSGHGDDGHHLAEATFKALALAMRQALTRNQLGDGRIPSTKAI